MSKKTQILCISITVLAIALAGGLFFVMYLSPDKATKPSDETLKLTLEIPERLLVSPKVSLYHQIVNAPPCTDGSNKMNLEESTEVGLYWEPRTGLRFDVPYNPQWGAPHFRFELYDQHGSTIRNVLYPGQFLEGLDFGKPVVLGCDNAFREYNLQFAPVETKEDLIARIEKTYSSWAKLDINSFDIEDKMVIQFDAYEGPGHEGTIIVIGKKHNYIFTRYHPSYTETIIKSIQFIN